MRLPIILFVLGLLGFLFGFGFFIAFLARNLGNKVPCKLYVWIEGIIIACIGCSKRSEAPVPFQHLLDRK